MKKEQFSDMMSRIDDDLLTREGADVRKPTKKSLWIKIGSIAACFALVAVLGIGMIQSGLFSSGEHSVSLDNGNTIYFVKSESAMKQLDIAFPLETRDLTEEELKTLFGDLTVDAYALFNGENDSIIGLEGTVDGVKLTVSTPGILLNDTVIEGEETVSDVGGVCVNAGYFTNKSTTIYYATFTLGNSVVYLENAGANDNAENVRNEIALAIQDLIDNGAIDLREITK